MMCRNFATGSSTGLPAKKIVCVSGRSAAWLCRSTRNAPKKIRNVSAAKTANVPHSRPKLFQKTVAIAERAEPEQVNPVGDGGAAADEDQNDNGKKEINCKARTLRFAVRRPIDCFGHFPPHSGDKCALSYARIVQRWSRVVAACGSRVNRKRPQAIQTKANRFRSARSGR